MNCIIIYIIAALDAIALLALVIVFYKNSLPYKEYLLVGDGDKYWSYRLNDEPISSIKFKFNRDHTYAKYDFNLMKNSRSIVDDSKIHPDIVFPKQIWRIHNDSIIETGEGILNKIIYITKDSFACRWENGSTSYYFLYK